MAQRITWWEYLAAEHGEPQGRAWLGHSSRIKARSSIAGRLVWWDAERANALLRIDEGGTIRVWSRVAADITGLAPRDVCGKTYAELLQPLPISAAYRNAAIDWVSNPTALGDAMRKVYAGHTDDCSVFDSFPLPLPHGYAEEHPESWVELRASYGQDAVGRLVRLDKQDKGLWIGGAEFAVRHASRVPSLKSLCERATSGGAVLLEADGSLRVSGGAAAAEAEAGPAAAVVPRPRRPLLFFDPSTACAAELDFVREACDVLCRISGSGRRKHAFSRNFRDELATAGPYARVLAAFAGAIEDNLGKDRVLYWRRARTAEPHVATAELYLACRDNRAALATCGGRGGILPYVRSPRTAKLTLRIERGEPNSPHADDQPSSGAKWAVVEVPASLSFLQLHRVVLDVPVNLTSCIYLYDMYLHITECFCLLARVHGD